MSTKGSPLIFILLIVIPLLIVVALFSTGGLTGKASFIDSLWEAFGFGEVTDQSSNSELPAPEIDSLTQPTDTRSSSAEAGTALPVLGDCEEWITIIDGTDNFAAEGLDITVDQYGDIYITGFENSANQRENAYVIKMDGSNGAIKWKKIFK